MDYSPMSKGWGPSWDRDWGGGERANSRGLESVTQEMRLEIVLWEDEKFCKRPGEKGPTVRGRGCAGSEARGRTFSGRWPVCLSVPVRQNGRLDRPSRFEGRKVSGLYTKLRGLHFVLQTF